MSAPAMRRNHSAFGSRRERQVAELLRAEGWVVFRCAASKPCDLVAMGSQEYVPVEPVLPLETFWGTDDALKGKLLVEVKGTARSPWVAWGPAERAELRETARKAGAVPLLAWWPPHAKDPQWIGEAEWPSA